MSRPRRSSLMLGLTSPLLLLLAACGGDEEAGGSGEGEQSVVATTREDAVSAWLSPTDAMDPARWLASREAGHLVPEDDPQSRRLHESLDRAKAGFIEDRRMMANRTVQLAQMLGEAGRPEGYVALVDGLGAVAARSGRKQLYGEMCQHYFNTRKQGAEPREALDRLSERYGGTDDARHP